MLSGCRSKPSIIISECLAFPTALLPPCLMPEFKVQTWGDYPQYVEQTRLALARCNTQRDSALLFLKQQKQ
ncbi:Rz1-like lysis system protein LysC [Yersinia bercovieri]|uniref:Rz1-like lysis system protein LysC n=1 Tax=Yersinia bercovieri TaxID=634 RepID=UPI0021BDD458|nr:Rz1-like lysis system protein LysC [Yersinia bercovieri]